MKENENINKVAEEQQGSKTDYKDFFEEYRAARQIYNQSYSEENYRAMGKVFDKYGIPLEERLAVNTLSAMQENTAHSGGEEICRLPAQYFEKSLSAGRWNEIINILKSNADAVEINELTAGRYPMLGEIFKSDRKNSLAAMSAFGLFKEGDSYVVRVDPEKLQMYYYKTFFENDIKEIKASQVVNSKSLIDHSKVTFADQEQYLDRIASHLKNMKMTGKEIDDKTLLGVDLQRGTELFGLREFSPELQTDILISMAYLRSEAFQDRLRTSLGYEKGEAMTEEHQKILDNISQQARKAYKTLSFERIDGIWDDHLEDTINGFVAHLSEEKQSSIPLIRHSHTAAHEIAHTIYKPYDGTGLDPGAIENDKTSFYGKEDSPYNKITASKSDPVKAAQFYQKVISAPEIYENTTRFEQENVGRMVDLVKGGDTSVIGPYLQHDEIGYERAADVHAARMEMLHRGIYNPFSGEPLTEQHIRQLYKANPDNRIFNYWNTKEAAFFLRNIAQAAPGKEASDDLRTLASQSIQQQLAEVPEKRPSLAGEGQGVTPPPITVKDGSDLVAAAYEQRMEEMRDEVSQDRGLRV